MHICFIAEHFHPPWTEGYQNTLREIVLLLQKEMKISVISLSTDIDHLTKWHSGGPNLNIHHIAASKPSLNIIRSTISVLKLLQSVAKKEKIDAVHVYNVKKGLFSLLIHRFLKKTVIVQVSKSLIPYNPNLQSKIHASIDIQMLKYSGARAFVVTSLSLKREMENLGFNKHDIIHIHPLVDTDKFRPMNRNKLLFQNGFGVGYFYIGYLGRIATGRGVMELFIAFKRLIDCYPNIRLILAFSNSPSEGKYRIMFENYIKNSKLSNYIICLGTSNTVEKIYNMLDLVIVPLVGKTAVDPPLTLLEAMSCRKVVIASKIGDIPRIIKDGENGYLVSPGDINELYEKIKFVVSHPETLDKVGNNARETILGKFSRKIIAKRYFELYSTLG